MKTKHSSFADIEPQADQIQRKIDAKLNKPLFISKLIIFKVTTSIIFRVTNLDRIIWNCIGNQLDLSTVSFDLSFF